MPGGNVYNVPVGPDRGAEFAKLIAGIIGNHQQRQLDEQQKQQDAQLQIMKAPPEQRQALAQMLGIQYDPAQYPVTSEQTAAAERAKFAIQGFQNPDLLGAGGPQSARYQTMTNAAAPSEVVKANVANDIYSSPPSFAPQMQPRQAIEDKITPTGQEAWTNQNVTLPKTSADIAHVNAQTSNVNATTGKVNAETRGITAGNNLLAGVGGAQPSGGGQPTGGPTDLSKASPVVRGLIRRQTDPSFVRYMGRTPQGMAQLNALEAEVQKYDPNFSMANYPKQVAAVKEYSQAGQTGKGVTAVNTSIRHLWSLYQDLGKMNNGDYPTVNKVGNYLANQLGNQKVQQATSNVDKDATAVANELNKAFRGSSQLSEKETAAWKQGLDQNTTPASGRGAISGAVKLLAGRINEVATSYTRDTGLPAPDFLSPDAKKILRAWKKMGIDGVDELLAGASSNAAPQASGGGETITTPDGLKWTKNADGSMTQVP